jgi:large subunit ribosomal protein L32
MVYSIERIRIINYYPLTNQSKFTLNKLIYMGLPSQRRTSRSKKERASHFALKTTGTSKCSECGSPVLPHHACKKCGNYKGNKVLNTNTRTERRMRRLKKK